MSIDGTNADYVTELGFELLLQSRPKDAVKCFRNAMKLDETSVTALTGETPLRALRLNDVVSNHSHVQFRM